MFLVLPLQPAATTVARNWVDFQSVCNTPREPLYCTGRVSFENCKRDCKSFSSLGTNLRGLGRRCYFRARNRKGLRTRFRVRFHEGSRQADQQGMRDFLRKRRLATRNPCGRWNHLLAHRRHNAIQRPESQAASVRRTESNGIGNPLQAGRLDGDRDRQDRSASGREQVIPSRDSVFPRTRRELTATQPQACVVREIVFFNLIGDLGWWSGSQADFL